MSDREKLPMMTEQKGKNCRKLIRDREKLVMKAKRNREKSSYKG